MKILKTLRESKEWKQFKYLWKKTEGGNIFIWLYTMFVSVITIFAITIFPAFFFLFFLFLPKVLIAEMEIGLFSNFLFILVVSLSIPQFFYIFSGIYEKYSKIAEGYR